MRDTALSRRLIRGTSWSLLANVSQALVKAGASVYLARVLGPSDMGVVLVVLSIVALLTIFADLGLSAAMARRLSEAPGEAVGTVATTLRLLFPVVLLVSAVTYVNADAVVGLLGLPSTEGTFLAYRSFLVLLLVTGVLFKVVSKGLEGLRRVDVSGRITVFVGWAPWGMAVAVAGLIGPSASLALAGKLAGEVVWVGVLAVALFGLVRGAGARRPASISSKLMITYALPMVIVTAGVYLYTQSAILMVQYFLGSSEAGLFGTALRFIEILRVPAAAVGAAVAATFVHLRSVGPERSRDLYAVTVRSILITYLPMGVGLWLLADAIVPFVFGEEYAPAAAVVQWYVPFLVLSAASSTTSLALVYLGFAGRRALWVMLSAVANVVLMVILIPAVGIIGAAIATLATYAPLALWYQWRLARDVGAAVLPPRTRRVFALVVALGAVFAILQAVFTTSPVVIGAGFAAAYALGLVAVGAVGRDDLALLTRLRR